MLTKYFVEIEQISLSKYRTILEKSELLPGRRILLEKLKERFDLLQKSGIINLLQLVQALKTPDKIKRLSKDLNIPTDYLIILRREVNRLLPKPVPISDFPGVDIGLIKKLNKIGIKNTLHFFDRCNTKKKRAGVAKDEGIDVIALEELIKLSDLSRIWGVGPVFCRIFYETGVDTVKKVAKSNANKLYGQLIKVNEEKNYTRAKFTIKDVQLCIDIANDLPKTIEI